MGTKAVVGMVVALMYLVACDSGGGDEPMAEEGSGGDTGEGGEGGEGGDAVSAAGGTSCSAPEPSVVLADTMLDHLQGTGEGVIFIDRTSGPRWIDGSIGGALRRIDSEGDNDTVLYTAVENELLRSFAVDTTDVFFLVDRYTGVGEPGELTVRRVPLDGGTVESVAYLEPPIGSTMEVIAVDAHAVLLNLGEGGLIRVALPGGEVTTITEDRVLHNAWLVDEAIYYTRSPELGESELAVIESTATSATGDSIFVSDDGACTDPLIAATGLFCEGGAVLQVDVERYTLSGAGPTVIAEFDEGLRGQLVAADSENVYYVASDTIQGHPLWQIPIDGRAPRAISCDRYELSMSDTGGPYPTNRGLFLSQVAVNDGEILWLERRPDDDSPTLYRAPL